jgi:hypothetical protein
MSDSRRPEPGKCSDSRTTPPTLAATLDEIVPLVGVVPVAGPPGHSPRGTLLVTAMIVLLAAALLVVALAAIIASPYLLVRRLRAAWAHHSMSHTLVHLLPANPPTTAEHSA